MRREGGREREGVGKREGEGGKKRERERESRTQTTRFNGLVPCSSRWQTKVIQYNLEQPRQEGKSF